MFPQITFFPASSQHPSGIRFTLIWRITSLKTRQQGYTGSSLSTDRSSSQTGRIQFPTHKHPKAGQHHLPETWLHIFPLPIRRNDLPYLLGRRNYFATLCLPFLSLYISDRIYHSDRSPLSSPDPSQTLSSLSRLHHHPARIRQHLSAREICDLYE